MTTSSKNEKLQISRLKTENVINPQGIDKVQPRLSFILESKERLQKQTAYQILVSSSKQKIDLKEGDFWNTGKIESDQSIQIPYEGSRLSSSQKCYWCVRVWDREDKPTPWSETAFWTMGLLNEEDWQAKWVRMEENECNIPDLKDVKWISASDQSLETESHIGNEAKDYTYFRYDFDILDLSQIKQALLLFSADSHRKIYVNGNLLVYNVNSYQETSFMDIRSELRSGRNVLAAEVRKSPNHPKGYGLLVGKLVLYSDAEQYDAVKTGSNWKAAMQFQEGWNNTDFDDDHWKQAQEVATSGDKPWQKAFHIPAKPVFSSFNSNYLLRKEFNMDKPLRHATIYASALGLYESYINGQRIGQDVLSPGWTDYNKRVIYQTYDVTLLLNQGKNALGAVLGVGWYAGSVGPFGSYHYGIDPSLIMQLNLEYEDGTRAVIGTDKTWKASRGPILYSDLIMGEIYDAREEIPGWNDVHFNDHHWSEVTLLDRYEGKLVAQTGPAVQIIEDIQPVAVTEPVKGTFVIDLGQNISGWLRIKVEGPEGTKVTMRFAERLYENGMIYTENLRGAKQTDVYILKGQGEEIYEPRFTFHGFQYVEITGYTGELTSDRFMGRVVHSHTPSTGKLVTSDPVINQLFSNIYWGQRDNFLSVPTDCPQRDERLGWTGDAQIFVRTASYNMDVSGFFTKWMIDVDDAQRVSGAFTNIAPDLGGRLGAGIAAWADAGVIIPWTIYQMYGDQKIVSDHYPAMKKYIEFLRQGSSDFIRPNDGLGDWLSIEADTPKDVLSTAYFAYSTKLMSKMAQAIGKKDDALYYEKLFMRIRNAFNQAFVHQDGRINGDTQTVYALALHMDLLPDEARVKAAEYLVSDIQNKDYHISTGFVGVSYLLPVLSEAGYVDVAYRLLHQETFPSWLYSIKQGATTIWERWDGWTSEKGFQTPSMNSFNHYSLGSVGEWIYRYVAGIDVSPDHPGFKHFIIHPRPGDNLTYVKCEYDSVSGNIISEWELKDGKFMLNITVPVNTTASVYLPAEDNNIVFPADQDEGIKYECFENGHAVYNVASGNYNFVVNRRIKSSNPSE